MRQLHYLDDPAAAAAALDWAA